MSPSLKMFRPGSHRDVRPARRNDRRRHRPAVELLEAYQLLSTITVTNTTDSGPGSLRDAIDQVNISTDASNEIDFNIPADGSDPGVDLNTDVCYITLSGDLPTIFNPVTIDGCTEGDFRVT